VTWVFVIYISASGLYVPLSAYPTEVACEKAKEEWTFEKGSFAICMPGIMEKEKRRRKKRLDKVLSKW
jgi:hypothetical protein